MANLLSAAAAYVGVPYRLHGRDLEGWDCWGCVGFARQALFGKGTPCWAEVFDQIEPHASAARIPEAAEALIRERLSAWREVSCGPGAVVGLLVYGRLAHVGLMLDRTHFLHAMSGARTVITRLTDPRWSGRVRGFYDA